MWIDKGVLRSNMVAEARHHPREIVGWLADDMNTQLNNWLPIFQSDLATRTARKNVALASGEQSEQILGKILEGLESYTPDKVAVFNSAFQKFTLDGIAAFRQAAPRIPLSSNPVYSGYTRPTQYQ